MNFCLVHRLASASVQAAMPQPVQIRIPTLRPDLFVGSIVETHSYGMLICRWAFVTRMISFTLVVSGSSWDLEQNSIAWLAARKLLSAGDAEGRAYLNDGHRRG